MDKQIRRFRPDRKKLEKALLKAHSKGLEFNMRQLINYLIAQVNSGKIDLKIEGITLLYDDYTTFSYDEKAMLSIREKINKLGFTSTNDFVVNLLFHSYLNQK